MLPDIEIKEIRKQWKRSNSTVEVQENEEEKIEHKKNQKNHLQEQGVQEVSVEQGNDSEQQQETHHISLFLEDDEILVKKAEMESLSGGEKERLMRVVKKIRRDPERILANLRYIDRKKVRAAP